MDYAEQFDEGYDAFCNDEIYYNPYYEGTPEWHAWEDGWNSLAFDC